jgi:hypothetical protein
LAVLAFDDTTPEGRGFPLRIPAGKTTMKLRITHRAKTAPGASADVMLALHHRDLPDNAAVTAWTASNLATITLPANDNFQYIEYSLSLATLGLTAGTETQFELVRRADQAGDNLAGDWLVRDIQIEWA